jgi:hypothetical protein
VISLATPAASPPRALMVSKNSLRRAALLVVVPLAAYALVRPFVSSDTLALAIAAGIPILYSILLALARRQIEVLAGLSAIGFSVGCLISVLTGDSSLPLKLHEAFITFGIGLVLVIAVLIRRPMPIARLLRIRPLGKQIDSSLGAVIGGFFVLHALVHFGLAVSLSTSSYLIAGRVINWGTIALGIFALSAYLRGTRSRQKPDDELSGRSAQRARRTFPRDSGT